tara:strand:+ start:88 stop:585 length:498 start_codon:yes stop_codon:yes gene_type:complete
MSQPDWKLVTNLGDVNPFPYGGLFVFVDRNNLYSPEMERLEPMGDDDGCEWELRRVILDKCTYINGVLSDNEFHPDHPAWFATPEYRRKDRPQDTTYLSQLCDSMDMDENELIELFCSDDPIDRAIAYRAVGDYHGWDNLDGYPRYLSDEDAEHRCEDILAGVKE